MEIERAARGGLAAAAAAVMCLILAPALADDVPLPDEVVASTAQAIIDRLDGREAELGADPAQLYAIVNEIFLPVFDTRYAGRLVLGRHGRSASPAQRDQFIDTFYDFLVRSYADRILEFRRENLTIFSLPPDQVLNPKRVVVRTELTLTDGTVASVDYSLRLTPEGWRIFDVRIEGVSYVQTYRSQFDTEISATGLDAVIARLQARSREMAQAETPP